MGIFKGDYYHRECPETILNLYIRSNGLNNRWGLICKDCSNIIFYKLFFVNLAKNSKI